MIKTAQQQFIDSVFGVRDLADPSKLGQFDASAISADTARVLAFPNASGTIALEGWVDDNFLALDGEGTDVVNGTFNLTTTGLGTFAGLTLSGLTQGSVMFAGAGGVVSQDNSNLFWDDTNKRLGIGTASPGQPLHIKSATAGVGLRLDRAAVGNDAFLQFATGGIANWFVGLDNTPAANRPDFQIKTTNNTTPEFIIIRTSGNVGIGTITPSSKLSINGGLHVGGDSDAGDNNLLVDGTVASGATTITGTLDVNPSANSSIDVRENSFLAGAAHLAELQGTGTVFSGFTIKDSFYIRGSGATAVLTFANADLTAAAGISYATATDILSFNSAASYTFDGDVSGIGTLGCGVITQSGTTLANTYQPLDAELTSLAALLKDKISVAVA